MRYLTWVVFDGQAKIKQLNQKDIFQRIPGKEWAIDMFFYKYSFEKMNWLNDSVMR